MSVVFRASQTDRGGGNRRESGVDCVRWNLRKVVLSTVAGESVGGAGVTHNPRGVAFGTCAEINLFSCCVIHERGGTRWSPPGRRQSDHLSGLAHLQRNIKRATIAPTGIAGSRTFSRSALLNTKEIISRPYVSWVSHVYQFHIVSLVSFVSRFESLLHPPAGHCLFKSPRARLHRA